MIVFMYTWTSPNVDDVQLKLVIVNIQSSVYFSRNVMTIWSNY